MFGMGRGNPPALVFCGRKRYGSHPVGFHKEIIF
jgi:hypothetical protein